VSAAKEVNELNKCVEITDMFLSEFLYHVRSFTRAVDSVTSLGRSFGPRRNGLTVSKDVHLGPVFIKRRSVRATASFIKQLTRFREWITRTVDSAHDCVDLTTLRKIGSGTLSITRCSGRTSIPPTK
jgi:hypothetical protein